MNIFEPLLLGMVLSADSFSAAVAMGLKPHKFKDSVKFAFLSGGAELLAVWIGAMAGEKVISRFNHIDHWIAFFLLLAVSIHMFNEGLREWRNRDNNVQAIKFHGFIKLLIVSIATSFDALAVGVTLGISDKPLWPFLIAIGGWTFAATLIGMGIANRIPGRLSGIFNMLGSGILFILSVYILLS